jgi:hypothetical protein
MSRSATLNDRIGSHVPSHVARRRDEETICVGLLGEQSRLQVLGRSLEPSSKCPEESREPSTGYGQFVHCLLRGLLSEKQATALDMCLRLPQYKGQVFTCMVYL